ncbi:hypothetical protein HMN09_01132600 [Mycena chlorophos]|uniref:BTB domain-containing protein n=1 Tax=Mycena chlorophos TaxID=658473 RepID=A0A8H6VVV1_MYCCL|nr:hypothetical protein HMN09_01132600 [Mycena chlorophos]
MDVDQPGKAVHRVDELWFPDGNIIVQAGLAQYKVYRGTLRVARESSIFEDMLSIPQPPSPDIDLVDGYPVVVLPDAEIERWPDTSQRSPAELRSTMYTDVSVWGNKYAVDHLRRRALVHFTSQFRTTLEEWDSCAYRTNKANWAPAEIISWEAAPDNDASFLLKCIQVAREVEADWTMPMIFYFLTANFDVLGTRLFHGTIVNDVFVQISLGDQERLVTGGEKQRNASSDILHFLHSPPCATCTTRLQCLESISAAGRETAADLREVCCQSLDLWSHTKSEWASFRGICAACLKELKKQHMAARKKLWQDLPGIYGLQPWVELEKLKEEAIGDGLLT